MTGIDALAQTPPQPLAQPGIAALREFVRRHARLLVLTGAGISTESGIPGYRDANGNWQARKPIQWREFLQSHAVRQRYWARSMVGWPLVARARPNAAHLALAELQRQGRLSALATQNVDGLHRAAGSTGVIELHGNIGLVCCLDCGRRTPRIALQSRLEADNLWMRGRNAAAAPDGDAQLPEDALPDFRVPACAHCGGMLKPDVVFFGESVPRDRVAAVHDALRHSDALLVVGSSLTVYSGYRFCLAARAAGTPIAALNLGRTRADDMLALKVHMSCSSALAALVL